MHLELESHGLANWKDGRVDKLIGWLTDWPEYYAVQYACFANISIGYK